MHDIRTQLAEKIAAALYDPEAEFACTGCGFDLMSWEDGTRPPTCYECDNEPAMPVGNYVMKGGQYCDGDKRILALPGNHPDAHPTSEAEANRTMRKHGINLETGFWENEKRKEAAMRVAKQNAPEKRKETSKKTH